MITSDSSLEPDWDDDNIEHISAHGLRPEQVEELYYNDGPLQTIGGNLGLKSLIFTVEDSTADLIKPLSRPRVLLKASLQPFPCYTHRAVINSPD